MVFSSVTFIFYFLPLLLIVYFLAPDFLKNSTLLIFSLAFYAWGEPVYIILMLISIVINYFFGILIERARREGVGHLKIHMFMAAAINVSILFYFKYAAWVIGIINSLAHVSLSVPQLSLPIGISFYIFQALSYVADVYLERTPAQKSLPDFALYITMFPQLVAGPIVKYTDIKDSLRSREITAATFGYGAQLFIRGMAKKILLANTLGAVFTDISSADGISAAAAWLGAVCYSLQLYFDFSGYSDMAIGLGRMFGFTFSKNFDHPYTAASVTEFWRRWHISLSSWFRDYVYIPLGGNRLGKFKHIRNIFIVWALTGLWHGASGNFLLWGLYYGAVLTAEKYLFKDFFKRHNIFGHIYTILIFVIGWVIFAFTDFSVLGAYLGAMFNPGNLIDKTFLFYMKENLAVIIWAVICCTGIVSKLLYKLYLHSRAASLVLLACVFILCTAFLVYDSYNPFLYFRF